MNDHALRVIEFPSALELIAGRASSALGAARIREASPSSDREFLVREHSRVAAVRSLIEDKLAWTPQPIPDIRPALVRLRVEGAASCADRRANWRSSSSGLWLGSILTTASPICQ